MRWTSCQAWFREPIGVPDKIRGMVRDLVIVVGAFAATAALAAALGAANFGTALAFGQFGFAIALVWVLLRD